MNNDEKIISEYYDNLAQKHGNSYRACDYGSEDSQLKKFSAFLNFFNNDSIDILDVGCGVGDFYKFLIKNFASVSYEGIDLSEKMVSLCKEKHENVLFTQRSILEYTDRKEYCIANGIFYLIQENPEEKMKEVVTHMFDISTRGIAFNSLSSLSTKQEKNEFYADPVKTFEFCSKLTSKVVLKHDYLPHDFTIYMYK